MQNLLEKVPKQINEAFKLGNRKIEGKIDKIIVCGMGASGITGDILKDIVKEIPVVVSKDYNIPEYVDSNTLAFVISYSGNTEETISAYEKIKKKTKKVVVIAATGRLADEKGAIIVPPVIPTRYGLHYLFFPILKVLEKSKVIGRQDKNVKEAIRAIKSIDKKQTKKIASQLKDKTPIICVPNRYKSIGVRWRQQFNENSKVQAINLVFPELDHNALEGYNSPGKFELIVIRDKNESERERRRIEITEKLLSKHIPVNEVWMRGKSDLAKIFYAIYFGDWMTYQLGIIDRINPYENKLIIFLKKQLKKVR
ncbi:MAG: bifunctional phosphoglucose/phosphomannose isomerase [archaeon]